MLKPSTPSASHDSAGSSGSDDGAEYYPHVGGCSAQTKSQTRTRFNPIQGYFIYLFFCNCPSHPVFLQNKARREDFCPRNLKNMHVVVDKLMAHSHLKYKGTELKKTLPSNLNLLGLNLCRVKYVEAWEGAVSANTQIV